MREKFLVFNSFRQTAEMIEDKEMRLLYLEAIFKYGITGEEPTDPMVKIIFNQTKFTMDRSLEISESASERGKRGGRPKSSFSTDEIKKKLTKANESKGKLTKANESEGEGEGEGEKEVEVEYKNKKESIKKKTPPKNSYGDFVKLSDDEYSKLLEIFGKKRLGDEIEKLNNYIGSKGAKYKSHYHTIRKRNEDFINKWKNKPPDIRNCDQPFIPSRMRGTVPK